MTEYLTIGASVVVAVIGYLTTDKIQKMEKTISENKREIKEIKENYLDRFEKLNASVLSSKLEILEKFHEVQISLINKLNEKN